MNKIKEYIVEVAYRQFRFVNAQVALEFAMNAAQSCVVNDLVCITIVTESEDEDDA